MNTWYLGEITSACYTKNFKLVHRNHEGIETMDLDEFDGWYNMTKNGVDRDMEFIGDDGDRFSILAQTEEHDPKDASKEKRVWNVWRWTNNENGMFFEIGLEKWTEERYEN